MHSELVADALQVAIWCSPGAGSVAHADRGRQYTSRVLGHPLRDAGLLGSVNQVASSADNPIIESFWLMMQRELLDQRIWQTLEEFGSAISRWDQALAAPRLAAMSGPASRHSLFRTNRLVETSQTAQAHPSLAVASELPRRLKRGG